MALLGIGNFEELFAQVKSSSMMTAWLAYLDLRDEEEAEKYRKLVGGD